MDFRLFLSSFSWAGRAAGMIFVFFAVQFGCILLGTWWGDCGSFMDLPSSASAFWLLVSSALTVLLFKWFSWIRPTDIQRGRWSWAGYMWATAWMLSAILPVNLLTEAMQLDNTLERQFIEWMQIPWGVFNIVVAAPLAEEVVFRAGLIGAMHRSGCNNEWAMVVSALLFALLHGNPAQMPVALLLGLMLGYVYLQSRSLWPGFLAHVANNLIGALTAKGTDEASATLTDTLGGLWQACAASLLSLLLFVFIFYRLHRYSRTPR